jgi:copper chaperone
MNDTITYSVPGMHCAHCQAALEKEIAAVGGVESVDVELDTKLVTVRGSALSDEALRAAIDEAGYEVKAVR